MFRMSIAAPPATAPTEDMEMRMCSIFVRGVVRQLLIRSLEPRAGSGVR